MLLMQMTWPQVDAYLETSKAIIIPIGSVEQHGPMGLLGTDAMTAEYFAKKLGRQVQCLVGPTISVGMAVHHMDFAGSMSLRPTTLIALIEDYVDGLVRHGFRKILFVNGHGGNIPTVQTAFSQIYGKAAHTPCYQELALKLTNWFTEKSVVELANKLFDGKEGHHATPGEISITALDYPFVLDHKTEVIPSEVSEFTIRSAAQFRKSYPNGVMGSYSHLANLSAAEKISQLALEKLEEQYYSLVQA